MEIKETIGIDIGKLTMEVRIHTNQKSREFANTITDIKAITKWIEKSVSYSNEDILFAFEHTGLYSQPLSLYLSENTYN